MLYLHVYTCMPAIYYICFSPHKVFPWVTCNDSLTRLYIAYLEDLVSTHPSFIQPVLHNLCSRLLNPGLYRCTVSIYMYVVAIALLHVCLYCSTSDHSTDGVYFNIHDALRSVLHLVPRCV